MAAPSQRFPLGKVLHRYFLEAAFWVERRALVGTERGALERGGPAGTERGAPAGTEGGVFVVAFLVLLWTVAGRSSWFLQ